MKYSLLSFAMLVIACSCGLRSDDEYLENNQDTLIRFKVVNGKNQPGYLHPGKRFKFHDTTTNEFLTRRPYIGQYYYTRFSLDSVGGRPVVISTRGPVEIGNMGNQIYRVMFIDTGRADIMFGLDCTRDTAYQVTEIITDSEVIRREVYDHHDTLWFGGGSDIRPQWKNAYRYRADLPGDSSLTVFTATSIISPSRLGTNFRNRNLIEWDSIAAVKRAPHEVTYYRWLSHGAYNGSCEIKNDVLLLYYWQDSIGCISETDLFQFIYRIQPRLYKSIKAVKVNNPKAASFKECL